jgi:hypothetical protein
MMEVVTSDVGIVEVVSLLDVEVVPPPPDTTPGHWIWPADAEIARISVRIVTAHVLRKVFTLGAS